ncbi:MAG: dTDP-4-dehydrorhamnose 3,5-epimerase [Synechococcaceae cyanobacterium RL_1_2]|nr:dTDP-4-dehydrorhamnose 3,5-epimerase [Synechococcaceae cyanobacterium RL_1_2]
MELNKTKITGCYELVPKIFQDDRGIFVKTFHTEIFKNYGLDCQFAEEYYSYSYKDVLRGLHFQTPPKDHTKIVYCVAGAVTDVVVDLRVGSPSYGEFAVFDLNAETANLIYIPPGLAHGFQVKSDMAIMMYKVSTVYSPQHDSGILWNSMDIPWRDKNPIISQRDSQFIKFTDFNSPFVYGEN